jgi:tetratricopeptide (TPR) repeat protein
MDSLITAAARALASGDALRALNFIALRDDPPALALRGIALAQIGDLARARVLLRRAAGAFGRRDAIARSRCVTAETEIALVTRDLAGPLEPLRAARLALERYGDRRNAAHARYLEARFLLLLGRLDEAEHALAACDKASLPLPSRAAHALVATGIAMRRLRIKEARTALAEAERIARNTSMPSLAAEVESAAIVLDAPAARLITRDGEQQLRLDDIEALLASSTLVVDACRQVISQSGKVISLETRPVLFALARALAETWPNSSSRAALLAFAFRAKHVDESHRARLRVEIGRLRRILGGIAAIDATRDGFVLVPYAGKLVVLAPPSDEEHASLLALLSDGEAWSSSALALALGASQRSMQRALEILMMDGKVRAIGRGRARRWMAPPVPGFPTALLLPTALPSG